MEQALVRHDTHFTQIQADTDQQLIALWLHGRPASTQSAHGADVARFLAVVGKPLRSVTLGDVQAFADSLQAKAPATRARILSSIKSLFAFGYRLGYLPFDVGRPLRVPARKSTLAERIMTEADTHRVIALEPNRRNRVTLCLLYASGVRVSELCGLKWRDLKERGEAGQVTVFGKGGKTHTILLSVATWRELVSLCGGPDGPVFPSRKQHGHLDRSQVLRIVQTAAKRAGVAGKVSPHWMRHAHASHALDRGAPIHLVQATLGHSSVATTGRYLHARPTESSSKFLAV
jgi:site-specific recombinase XerD